MVKVNRERGGLVKLKSVYSRLSVARRRRADSQPPLSPQLPLGTHRHRTDTSSNLIMSQFILLLAVAVALLQMICSSAFVTPSPSTMVMSRVDIQRTAFISPLHASDDKDNTSATKTSLEDKMASWEASEEEIKAASLGGVVPGRADAFDLGLYVLFVPMVAALLGFFFFPMIIGNIDTSEFGPPPTI